MTLQYHTAIQNYDPNAKPVEVPPVLLGQFTMRSIEDVICEHYGIGYDSLHENTRKRNIVKLRQFAMYYMLEHKTGSLQAIGDYFGGFDHTTVLHSKQVILDVAAVDAEYREEFEKLGGLIIQAHMEARPNKTLTNEERRSIMTKAVEDATTILANATSYVDYGWLKPITANVTGPDGKLYKITFELHGGNATT